MPHLIRLVYVSTLSADTDQASVEAIVEEARRKNAENAITGVIAFENGRACQVLEGEEAGVLALFSRIAADKRHHGVVELDRRAIEARRFGEWDMARRAMIDLVTMAYT